MSSSPNPIIRVIGESLSEPLSQDRGKESDMTTYFCDGLKEVTVVNGVVRLEFHRLETVERGQNRELRPVVEFIVALPLQGFVHAVVALENLRDRFAAQGVINPAGASEGGLSPPPPAKSPNFP